MLKAPTEESGLATEHRERNKAAPFVRTPLLDAITLPDGIQSNTSKWFKVTDLTHVFHLVEVPQVGDRRVHPPPTRVAALKVLPEDPGGRSNYA